jgi:diguanylate cyclase (GGDEF)-like protein/PAS domain S-box-containing protein
VGDVRERVTGVELDALLQLVSLDAIVVAADHQRHILWVSDSVTDILGWTPDEFMLVCTHLIHPDDQPIAEAMSSLIRSEPGVHHGGEGRHLAADGTWKWLRITACNDLEANGVVVTVFRDVTAEHDLVDRLERAEVDTLTGLETRARGAAELAERLGSGEHRVAALFCDIDGFKAVNDRLGHGVGDEVLVEVAHRVQSALRPDDVLVRWGGDELLAIADVADIDEAVALAGRIRAEVDRDPPGSGTYRPLSVSIGIAMGALGEDVDDVVTRADRAMYAAKRTGIGVRVAPTS